MIGPRQAGKSTAIWAYLAELGQPVLFLDCEQRLVRNWCQSAPTFLADLSVLALQTPQLFFEEVQHLEEAGLFLKGLVDRKVAAPVLVTGSSSYHLGARTRESLAGRASRVRILPFSLAEVCQDLEGLAPIVRLHRRQERYDRHVVVGGYPAVWLSAQPEEMLTELVEAVILRDASDLFKIQRPDAFRLLLRLLAGQVGSLVNLAEWASILGVNRDTVASYLSILDESHIIASVFPYVGGKRAELTSRPKVFLLDNGIRNRLVHDFSPLAGRVDAGAMLENWVASELVKSIPEGESLRYWRSAAGAEVDFVLTYGDSVVGIEVKAAELQRPQLKRSAHSFLAAYRPRHFLVVNTGLSQREFHGKTEVHWLHPADLSDRVRELLAQPV